MAIFTTLKERNRVYNIIENREKFEDLTPEQTAEIEGIYEAIERIESLKEDIEHTMYTGIDAYDKITEDVCKQFADNAIQSLEISIAEMYVGFADMNANGE